MLYYVSAYVICVFISREREKERERERERDRERERQRERGFSSYGCFAGLCLDESDWASRGSGSYMNGVSKSYSPHTMASSSGAHTASLEPIAGSPATLRPYSPHQARPRLSSFKPASLLFGSGLASQSLRVEDGRFRRFRAWELGTRGLQAVGFARFPLKVFGS